MLTNPYGDCRPDCADSGTERFFSVAARGGGLRVGSVLAWQAMTTGGGLEEPRGEAVTDGLNGLQAGPLVVAGRVAEVRPVGAVVTDLPVVKAVCRRFGTAFTQPTVGCRGLPHRQAP